MVRLVLLSSLALAAQPGQPVRIKPPPAGGARGGAGTVRVRMRGGVAGRQREQELSRQLAATTAARAAHNNREIIIRVDKERQQGAGRPGPAQQLRDKQDSVAKIALEIDEKNGLENKSEDISSQLTVQREDDKASAARRTPAALLRHK